MVELHKTPFDVVVGFLIKRKEIQGRLSFDTKSSLIRDTLEIIQTALRISK